MADKLAVLTTAFFPNLRPLRMFLESARKYNIQTLCYGVNETYCIWADMKIRRKIPVFEALLNDGYTHVLYTDARDAFFTGGLAYPSWTSILRSYGWPPCLASAEPLCNPDSSKMGNYPDVGKYRYHCVGGYLAEIPWMLEKFRRMEPHVEAHGDDAEIWQIAWEEGWFRPQIDYRCRLFQVLASCEDDLEVRDGMLFNRVTESCPRIFHLNGGYSDPAYGKYDHMIGWWKKLHPEIEIKREDVTP